MIRFPWPGPPLTSSSLSPPSKPKPKSKTRNPIREPKPDLSEPLFIVPSVEIFRALMSVKIIHIFLAKFTHKPLGFNKDIYFQAVGQV